MDCLTQQRAGWEPTQFFDKDELRATGIDAPSFAEVNQHYRYDKALNTLETKDKGEQHFFTLNRNNQITQVYNQNREQERYAYDECGYLIQRRVGHENYGLIQNPHHPEFHAQRQIIQHQDIYQKGHKLYRLNENYYEYDKAGRLVTKVEKRDGFRKQETDYRWNGKNELIGITTPKGEVWHYKYDALGRRIAKACPQQHLRIEYLWDGDQIAYTQTFKNDELVSERHSVFNGFELIAQQDRYQQLKQTIDGNIVEWKNQTHYAVVQPNGNVLGLLTPEGKLGWKPQNKSLWGLSFNQYNFNSNLDPNLLFAGQWFDEESGLAYNRFRYYDPENGNYICSDPIGLDGGETPYFYTHNPEDITDSFGLTSWLDIVKSQGVTPKANVVNPHGHHIIFKGSFSEIPNMRSALDRSIKIANKYDVPLNFDKKNIIGRSNLMIASNTKDVHTVKNAEKIASLLEKADKRASKWMDLGIMNKKQASSYINKEIIRAGGKVFGKYGIKKCKS